MLMAVAAVCGPAAAQSWNEVVAAAEKEGKLTLYHNIRPAGIEVVLQKFRAAFPKIQTEQIRLGSGPLNERFSTEFTSGRNLADVLISYADDAVMQTVKERFTEWEPPEFKGNFPASIRIDGRLYVLQQAREVIIWNKGLVKDADAPREWADLFDPKWKGKVALNTPWRSISVQQLFAYWEDIGIKDAAERMKANEVRFFEGSSGVIQAVIRGDVAVAHLVHGDRIEGDGRLDAIDHVLGWHRVGDRHEVRIVDQGARHEDGLDGQPLAPNDIHEVLQQ